MSMLSWAAQSGAAVLEVKTNFTEAMKRKLSSLAPADCQPSYHNMAAYQVATGLTSLLHSLYLQQYLS